MALTFFFSCVSRNHNQHGWTFEPALNLVQKLPSSPPRLLEGPAPCLLNLFHQVAFRDCISLSVVGRACYHKVFAKVNDDRAVKPTSPTGYTEFETATTCQPCYPVGPRKSMTARHQPQFFPMSPKLSLHMAAAKRRTFPSGRQGSMPWGHNIKFDIDQGLKILLGRGHNTVSNHNRQAFPQNTLFPFVVFRALSGFALSRSRSRRLIVGCIVSRC